MWPDTGKTSELLIAVKQGEPNAVDRLFERHREALRRMVHLRLDRAISRRVDASDIVQETLLEASRRLESYLANPVLPFHLWLRHIARDHVIDAHRKHRLAQVRSVNREEALRHSSFQDRSSVELMTQLKAAGLTPLAAAIRQELERRFQGALEKLEPDDREVILMRHFEELSNQEVAKALGLTEPAAGMRYLRAIRRLRALLGSDREEEGA
jgi:RNA polymerase sigma-70 factor (ECF subfamily)